MSSIAARAVTVVGMMAFALNLRAQTVQHTPVELQFESTVLGRTVPIIVYLPPEYADQPEARYPVIYVTPGGAAEVESHPDYFVQRIDDLGLQPFLFVSVYGHAGHNGAWQNMSGLWVNSELNGRWEDYFIDEVIPYLDANYRTLAHRRHRIILGGSGGGYAAAYYPTKRPDVIGASHSWIGGNHSLQFCSGLNPYLPGRDLRQELLSTLSGPPYAYHPGETWSTVWQLFHLSAAFSPNAENPPYYVDLPYDSNGNVVAEVCERWSQFDPSVLVGSVPDTLKPTLSLSLGTKDLGFPFDALSEVFIDSLDVHGIPHVVQRFACGHGTTCPGGDGWAGRVMEAVGLWKLVQHGHLFSNLAGALVLPSRLQRNFGSVTADSVVYDLRLTNHGPIDAVLHPTTSDPAFSVPETVEIPNGGHVDLPIVFRNVVAGLHHGTLDLGHEGPGFGPVALVGSAIGTAVDQDAPQRSGFELYPSPARDNVTVVWPVGGFLGAEIRVYDVTGRQVSHRRRDGAIETPFSLAGLPPGIYFFRITGGGHHQIQPLVVR